jgi:hypothetical protein
LSVDESVARTLHSALVSYFRRDRAVAARTIHAAFAGADKQLLVVRGEKKKKKKKNEKKKKKKKKKKKNSKNRNIGFVVGCGAI